jgi:hypothetical protein
MKMVQWWIVIENQRAKLRSWVYGYLMIIITVEENMQIVFVMVSSKRVWALLMQIALSGLY